MQRPRPKMDYDHNARVSGRKQRDQEEFDAVSPLSSSRTPYSGGKRTVKVPRTKNRKPTEQDTLTNENRTVEDELISNTAFNVYGFTGWSQVIFTIVLVALVGAQASTALTVKVLLILILVHNFISVGLLGMHHKIEFTCAKSIESEHSGLALLRHVRNDRRSVLLLLSAVVSCIAAIDIAYIARIVPSLADRGDSFRQSGVNTFTHRAIDVLSIVVFALAVPTAFLILAELRFGLQALMRKARVHDNSETEQNEGSDDEDDQDKRLQIVSPKQ